jgi:hypothetical protein
MVYHDILFKYKGDHERANQAMRNLGLEDMIPPSAVVSRKPPRMSAPVLPPPRNGQSLPGGATGHTRQASFASTAARDGSINSEADRPGSVFSRHGNFATGARQSNFPVPFERQHSGFGTGSHNGSIPEEAPEGEFVGNQPEPSVCPPRHMCAVLIPCCPCFNVPRGGVLCLQDFMLFQIARGTGAGALTAVTWLQAPSMREPEITPPSWAPPGFFCPLTGILMHDPVILKDSAISYERAAIEWALHIDPGRCPVSGLVLTHHSVEPDSDLRQRIMAWAVEHQPELLVRSRLLRPLLRRDFAHVLFRVLGPCLSCDHAYACVIHVHMRFRCIVFT